MRSGSVQVGGPLLPERVTLRAGQRLTAKLASGELLHRRRRAAATATDVRRRRRARPRGRRRRAGEPVPPADTVAPSRNVRARGGRGGARAFAARAAAFAAGARRTPEPPSASPPPAPAPAPRRRPRRRAPRSGSRRSRTARRRASFRSPSRRARGRGHHQRRRRPRRRPRRRRTASTRRCSRSTAPRWSRSPMPPAIPAGPRSRSARSSAARQRFPEDAVRARRRVFPGSARRRSRRGRGGAGLVPPLSRARRRRGRTRPRRWAGRCSRSSGSRAATPRAASPAEYVAAVPERNVHAAGARNPGEPSTVTAARRMRSNRCGWFSAMLVAAAATLPAARPVRAAPEAGAAVAVPAVTKVTVVDPPADDRVLVEAGLRIRSELDAAGLSNRAVTCAGGVGSVGCDATASAAAIALSRQDGLATIRVIATLPDGYELHRLIRVPRPAGGDDPSVLAVRAVELLRDIYLDVPRELSAPRAAEAAPAPPAGRRGAAGGCALRSARSCASFSARRCSPAGAGSGPRSRRCSASRSRSGAGCRCRGRRRAPSIGWSATTRGRIRRRRRRRW